MNLENLLRRASLLAVAALLFSGPVCRADDAKPYTVKDGKVDENTMKGYLYYGDQCMRCHGPDGLGSSYAPNLTDSLKTMSKQKFEETVINGKKDVNQASDKVMPSFGLNVDVATNLDNIYAYLKARSDGALGRGHPDVIGE
ncbi:MAG TPA: cytochrome c [Acetobacteraceae bacterium]|nr:cytochrome c [Acetobacteraceae bacterium]